MAVITRSDLAGLIPEPVTKEIFQGVVENSAVLRLGRKLPNMTAKTQSINVLDMLPLAYWVDGDTGFKQTSSQAWEKKKLYAEELAVIIPIPEAVLDDANYDIWGEVKPRIVEAMGRRIDDAVLFGNGAPSTWRDSIVDTAVNAGCSVTLGTDLFQDIMGENGLIAKAEESGYLPTGIMSAVTMRAKLRGLVDTNRQPIFMSNMQEGARYTLDGIPMDFPMNGSWDADRALMIAGDFSQLVYSIRQDVTYKILTEATIVDPTSREVVYSLAQQDMVALRAVMRLGWEIPNPVSAFRANLTDYSPFAVLVARRTLRRSRGAKKEGGKRLPHHEPVSPASSAQSTVPVFSICRYSWISSRFAVKAATSMSITEYFLLCFLLNSATASDRRSSWSSLI